MNEFWENLTPLDSSHLEVFLGIFLGIFHFFNFKFKFWILAGFIPVRTGTGPVRFDRLTLVEIRPQRGKWHCRFSSQNARPVIRMIYLRFTKLLWLVSIGIATASELCCWTDAIVSPMISANFWPRLRPDWFRGRRTLPDYAQKSFDLCTSIKNSN